MAEQNEEGKKTIVSFIVGLLIGGLLVWSFGSNPEVTTPTDNSDSPDVTEPTDATDSESNENDESDTTVNNPDTETSDVDNTTTEVATLPTGEGSVTISDRTAGSRVPMESATFPVSEGWVGIRDYNNGQLGMILGVVRFSEEQGLVPNEIILQRPTTAGREYAVVFYTEDGDLEFNLATDVQIEGIVTTFTASE